VAADVSLQEEKDRAVHELTAVGARLLAVLQLHPTILLLASTTAWKDAKRAYGWDHGDA